MIYKKIISFVLAVIMLLCFTSCKNITENGSTFDTPNEELTATRDYLTLLYSSSDGFNPYTVKTEINRNLCKLIYEPLVKLDNEFKPQNSIADEITFGEKTCTVTLKNITFSDGTPLTSKDVVYSFNIAKKSESSYASKLYNAEKCTADGDKKVIFSLLKDDKYFANLLTFPIIKSESDKVTDSDSVLQPPVGSGRFKVNSERDGLELNNVSFKKKSNIKKIILINAPDIESVTHYAQIGAADIYYSDISDGNITRMSGRKVDINLNSLVYLGINQNYGQLSQNLLRQALSSGIDRAKICQNAYFNNAIAANGFFNPVWSEVNSVQNIQITANKEITIENLEKIGYNSLDKNGKRVNSSGNSIELTLLVNSENRIRVVLAGIIASQLLEYGIKISVIERPYEQYLEALKKDEFQLYIGEVKLTENMDFSQMFTKDGSMSYGLPDYSSVKENENQTSNENVNSDEISQNTVVNPYNVVSGFYEAKNSITDIATVLQSEMPFVPLCYRTGALFYNDNIENVINSSECDIYFSIESYICNN